MTANTDSPAPDESATLTPRGWFVFSTLAIMLGAGFEVWTKLTIPHHPHYPWDRLRFLPSWLNDFYAFQDSHPRLIGLCGLVFAIFVLMKRQKTSERLTILFI